MRSTRRAKALAATALAALPFGSASTAAADGPTNWQHNICGAAGCGGAWGGHPGALQQIKDQINSFSSNTPHALGLQEQCGQQFDDFKNFLRAKNSLYSGSFYGQLLATTHCGYGGTARDYGIGAFALDQYQDATRTNGPYANQYSGDEKRGWACIQGVVFSTPYFSCTSHATPKSQAKSKAQFNEYYQNVIRHKTNQRVFWGGDLYVYVNDIPNITANWSWTANREGDLCLSGTNTYSWTVARDNPSITSDNAKVDYSFRSGYAATTCATDLRLRPTSEAEMYPSTWGRSDHRVLGGYQPW